MTIIFSGNIGRCCVGGSAWESMQYLAGLAALGHDVYYLEECGEGSWVYNWESEELTTDLDYPAAFIQDCLEPLGLGERWIYRAGNDSRGMPEADFLEACTRADLLLIRAVPLLLWREEYLWPRRRAFIDVDPGFIQMDLVKGHSQLADTLNRCDLLFTIGQNIGSPGCIIPTAGYRWLKTLPPVSLPHWPLADTPSGSAFTTIMQWRGFRDVEFEGVIYGQKDREFPKFIDLPKYTSERLCIGLTGAPPENLTGHGWEVTPGWIQSRTPWSYRNFIQNSKAEFGVAKHGYVLMQGGWFSDRTVCYLASGKPVLIEDTGTAGWLPVGTGVVTFRELDDAVKGITAIAGDYERHRRMARQIAEEFFAAEKVLPRLLEHID